MTRRRKLLFVALTAVVAGVLLFVAVEIYLRIAIPTENLAELTGRKVGPHPMSKWAQVDAFAAYRARPGDYGLNAVKRRKTVNRHGLISTPELDVAKEAGTIRVVFFGGSSTAGTGINLADEQTWPFLVAQKLREKWPDRKIEFINAALGGYTTFESLGRLWSRLRPFEPDIAVVYHGWNDIKYFHDASLTWRWRINSDGDWRFERPIKAKVIDPHPIDRFIGWSQVFTRARLLLGENTGELGGASQTSAVIDPRSVTIFRQNLQMMRDIAALLEIDLYVVKQATTITATGEKRSLADYTPLAYDGVVAAFDQIYGVMDQQFPAERIIDMTVLSGRNELFYDHVHPTPQGAEAIAVIVADHLAQHYQP